MAPRLNYGPRLKRFSYTPPEEDAKLNILEGSVRSGKTWALIPKILYACRYSVRGWRIITGVSKSSIFVNVLNDLFDLVGPSNYNYNQQSGLLKLCKSNWIVKGAIDEGSEKYLRGMTVAVAICDEVTLMPREFFNMLLARMSPPGARLYATTNTDSPLHWLKTEYLDNDELRKAGLLFSIHCTMDDNPNLSPEFVESQKKLFKGLFYARLIEGKWVMAEGGIYRDCWWNELKFKEAPLAITYPGARTDRWISVDYGTDHPQVYLEFCDDGTTIWVTREWCWDSKKEMWQLTDSQYADKLIEFMGPNRGCQIICPPETAHFKAELMSRGLWVTDADSAVKEGIKTVTAIMGRQMIRIHESCKGLIREIETYAWDQQAAKHGDEKPIKSNDDHVDCLRYGLHGKIPMWRIMGASMKIPIVLPQRNL
jgi:PBSX family phage terminase large subunit